MNGREISNLKGAIRSGKGSFVIHEKKISKIGFKKGSSRSKVDIILKYFIQKHKFQDGFGIKSSLGSKPSLLNASRATNFRFLLQAPQKTLSKAKAKSLVSVLKSDALKFVGCLNPIFLKNLKMIDTNLDNILSQILISYYQGKGTTVAQLVEGTFEDLDTQKVVKQRMKDFLYYICVGMFPTKEWDGEEEIAGTLVYNKEEDLICLHRTAINGFKDYLYAHSFLDTASTTRHKFGYLFREGGQIYLDLNLLIRMY